MLQEQWLHFFIYLYRLPDFFFGKFDILEINSNGIPRQMGTVHLGIKQVLGL